MLFIVDLVNYLKLFFKLLTPLPMQASFVKYYLFSGLLLRHGYGMDICFR